MENRGQTVPLGKTGLYSLAHGRCDCLSKTCPRSSRSTVRHRWGGPREPPLSSDLCCLYLSFRWIKLFPGAILFSPIALLVTLFLTFRTLTMKNPSVFSFHASTSGRSHSAPWWVASALGLSYLLSTAVNHCITIPPTLPEKVGLSELVYSKHMKQQRQN